jgi:hypothetical protein
MPRPHDPQQPQDGLIGCLAILAWIAYMIVSLRLLGRYIGNFIVHVAYGTGQPGALYIVNNQGLLSNGQYLSARLHVFIMATIFVIWALLGGMIYLLAGELRMRWAFRRVWRK